MVMSFFSEDDSNPILTLRKSDEFDKEEWLDGIYDVDKGQEGVE